MDRVISSLRLVKLVVRIRGLLSENRVPEAILDKLKTYTQCLSEAIPDIKALNAQLMSEINHLNSREYLDYIKKTNNALRTHKFPFYNYHTCKTDRIRKYYTVKIVRYYDTIEWHGIIDRVFIIYIDMDNCNKIYKYYKKLAGEIDEAFCYAVRLSTLNH